MVYIEKKHWKNVLTRMIGIIHYSAKINVKFRRPLDVLFMMNNGHFFGSTETLNKSDPVLIKRVKRIKTIKPVCTII